MHDGDPRGLRLLDRPGEFRLRANYRIELLADLARDGAGPTTRADLSHIDRLLAFSLIQIECGDTGRILYESNNGEFPLLDGF
jgi:hypothetical protein